MMLCRGKRSMLLLLTFKLEDERNLHVYFGRKDRLKVAFAFCDKKIRAAKQARTDDFCYLFSSTGTGRFKGVVPSARLLTSSATSMPVASLMNAKDWAKPSLVWPETPAAPSKTVS